MTDHPADASLISATTQKPWNNFVNPMLTDMYQITMAYAYWNGNRHNDYAIFDMFFRKNPFDGEFTIFAGLDEVIKYVQNFRFEKQHIEWLKTVLPDIDSGFWGFLANLDCSEVKIYAIAEGTVVFPRLPLIRVEGPLAICQLLETTLLNVCNYSSLVCTNAVRFRLAAGRDKQLLEFGLRRAQGADGAMSASRYAYMGGFDGTSNVLAAMDFDIRPMGTHAHSLVSAYTGLDELRTRKLDGKDIVDIALKYRSELEYTVANIGELAAFISFAQSFPKVFLALVDTYDTLSSGVPNFICVALALIEIGYKPLGIRLDSGDLAYLSKEARRMFRKADERYGTQLAGCTIVASNDINEPVLISLNDQGHEIDSFGIGTNLVTCQAQPALGMVFKLVEINSMPRIKLSQDVSKVTIPGAKEAFRLIGSEGVPLLDLIIRAGETRPQAGKRILCRHPFDEKKRVYVTPTAVIPLLRLVWKGSKARLEERLTTDAYLAEGKNHAGSTSSGAVGAHVPPPSAGLVPLQPKRTASARYMAGHQQPAATADALNDGISPAASGDGIVVLSPSAASEGGSLRARFPSLEELRNFVRAQLDLIREDHLRPLNPTPYKVSVSSELFHFIHDLWMKEVPIPELE